jgi:hypothetical protein
MIFMVAAGRLVAAGWLRFLGLRVTPAGGARP